MSETGTSDHVTLAADIVSAYVTKNSVRLADLPELIVLVHRALQGLSAPAQPEQEKKLTPPVPVKKSITPDYLISLEDGRRYKSLKHHLGVRGLTPEQYREKWGLSRDYPMVAANYAKQRSEMAKARGLGQLRRGATLPTAVAPEPVPKRGRRKRTEVAA